MLSPQKLKSFLPAFYCNNRRQKEKEIRPSLVEKEGALPSGKFFPQIPGGCGQGIF
jgi:hypothetical protein